MFRPSSSFRLIASRKDRQKTKKGRRHNPPKKNKQTQQTINKKTKSKIDKTEHKKKQTNKNK